MKLSQKVVYRIQTVSAVHERCIGGSTGTARRAKTHVIYVIINAGPSEFNTKNIIRVSRP